MAKPSLHEVLKKHSKAKKKKTIKKRVEKRETRIRQKAPPPQKPVSHVLISAEDARMLFLDLPKDHKFWIKDGTELNNLQELYRALIEIDQDVFEHHVNREKDDFAKWVGDILGDTVLARRLHSSISKLSHTELVRERIEELKYRGKKIPRPHSVLDPDFSFIKLDKPPTRRPPRPREWGIERRFRIKPQQLAPDKSFIAIGHSQGGTSKIDKLMNSQATMINTVKKDVVGQMMVETEVKQLGEKFEELNSKLGSVETELSGLRGDIKEEHVKDEQHDEHMVHLGKTIRDLRDRERDILSEIRRVTKVEENIMQKSDQLMSKEKELSDKESMVLKREDKYNRLLQKYNNMLQELDKKVESDEQKILKLITAEAGHVPFHPVQQTGQRLKKPTGPSIVKDQHTIARGDELKLTKEIDRLVTEIKNLVKKKEYVRARHYIEKVTKILEKSDIDREYKKCVYYEIFELSTDIDLHTK